MSMKPRFLGSHVDGLRFEDLGLYWIAVKVLKLTYYIMGTRRLIGFPYYKSLYKLLIIQQPGMSTCPSGAYLIFWSLSRCRLE